jgi:ketosteroid isomerase-like protein
MTVAQAGNPPDGGDPSAATPDVELGWRWVKAFDDRDADALVALSDPGIAWHPSALTNQQQRTYRGHQGLRDWIDDVTAADVAFVVRASEVRALASGHLLVVGRVFVGDKSLSPFSMVLFMAGGKVVEGRSYLSEASMLDRLRLMEP